LAFQTIDIEDDLKEDSISRDCNESNSNGYSFHGLLDWQ